MNIKSLRNVMLSIGVIVLLVGCTAAALLERHTSSAYGRGMDYEQGYQSPHGEDFSVKKDIGIAYEHYLMADRLGDIRARAKIISLSSNFTPEQRAEIEKKVQSMSLSSIKNFYHVPPQYNRNLRK